MRERSECGTLVRAEAALERGRVAHLQPQLLKRRSSGARYRLIRRAGDIFEAELSMKRRERHHGYRRCAVRIGDKAVVVLQHMRVNGWHHQRNIGFHSERRGIINHDTAGRLRGGSELLRCRASHAEDGVLEVFERTSGQLINQVVLPGQRISFAYSDGYFLSRRTHAGVEPEAADGNIPDIKHLEHFPADQASSAAEQERYAVLRFEHWGLSRLTTNPPRAYQSLNPKAI